MKPPHIILAIPACAFFAIGQQSFISSSEFWPIFISKFYFSFDPQWKAVFLKPLFNLILFFFHLIPLNDTMHIQLVKSLFALNGAAQLVLLYLIFVNTTQKKWLALFATAIVATSPLYFTHFFAIRSDQLALTAFLGFLYTNLYHLKFKSVWNIFFIVLFPMIGLKHVYFSILAVALLDFKILFLFLRTSTSKEKFYRFLIILGIAVWSYNIALNSVQYFFASYENYLVYFKQAILLSTTESLLLTASLLVFISKDFRKYLIHKSFPKLALMQLTLTVILIIHPQKFDFFIASLTPIFYLSSMLFVIYLVDKKTLRYRFIYIALFFYQACSIFYFNRTVSYISHSKEQLSIIEEISKFVRDSRFSYLDGMGILPRQNNVGCFASPDDYASNSSCVERIKAAQPDVVILSTRLMMIDPNISSIISLMYNEMGPNLYLRKDLTLATPIEKKWPPPILFFGTKPSF